MSRVPLLRTVALLAATVLLGSGAALPSDAATQQGQQNHSAHKQTDHKLRHHKHKHKHRKHKKRKHKRKTSVTPAPAAPPTATTPPTNAAKIFRWGNAQLNDEFHGALAPTWSVNSAGVGLVRNQNGMLTLNTTETSGTVTAGWTAGARQYGRWEARVRTRQYGTSATPYRAVWELVPTSGDQCSRSIILSDSTIGRNPASLHVRTCVRTRSTPTRSRSRPTTSPGSSTPRS
jgi:hypothetical protein